MILIDTSIWVDHFRLANAALVRLLTNQEVLAHAFVIGELALGSFRHRERILAAMAGLPDAPVMAHDAVMLFIDRHGLAGLGIGYVDAHLLASVAAQHGTSLWTRDKRLHAAAARLSIAAPPGRP